MADLLTPAASPGSTTPVAIPDARVQVVNLTDSLEEFQTNEQRQLLDIVAELRRCGLDGDLPLPQIAVCGEQSAGKSSVLEALTEIPFPRQDNLCTRWATEITMIRAATESLTLKIIPADERPTTDQAKLKDFAETIVDLSDLPQIMEKARTAMGLDVATSGDMRPFARDVLSIVIQGPTRPQLTVVDLPGLIQANTKGINTPDRQMVEEITDRYIRQPRTICLAVIAATHDYANQTILTKVREADPDGERTLGVITKPDRLEPGSGRESAFLSLARNEDIHFTHGWHVVKNRKFEEKDCSIHERNQLEDVWWSTSILGRLPAETRGVKALRLRLSVLLFDAIKEALPTLRAELETALSETSTQLANLGTQRHTVQDCRRYLATLSMSCLEVTKGAIHGYYEGAYFQAANDQGFDLQSADCIRRVRAAVQMANKIFADTMRQAGAKYTISDSSTTKGHDKQQPHHLTTDEALEWVSRAITRARGKEPVGSYNPLVIGELFWEQSSKWKTLAEEHVDAVFDICHTFFDTLLQEMCPADVRSRLSTLKVIDALEYRRTTAANDLENLIRDKEDFPNVYNHYYTETVQNRRNARVEADLTRCIEGATEHHHLQGCQSSHTSAQVDVHAAVTAFYGDNEPDMTTFSSQGALDHMLSIYKVGMYCQRTRVTVC